MKLCSGCNQQNPDDASFCHQCGTSLDTAAAAEPVADQVTPSPPPIHDEEALWRQFIGPNADRYLVQFKKFSANGQPKFALSWNWPAFLFISFLWFLYRKMYLHAFVYAVGPMISTYMTGDVSSGLVWSVIAGATGNYLYYWHCREQIGEIKKAGQLNQPEQEQALKEAGGVQPYVIWVGVAFYLLFMMTLIKMVQEGPPDSDQLPAKPARSAAVTSVTRIGCSAAPCIPGSEGQWDGRSRVIAGLT
jgi:Protein of unknown function (DUF2628)